MALMNLGNIASAKQDFAGSLPYFEEGMRIGEPLLKEQARNSTKEIIRNCHWGLADSLDNLGRDAEAIPHWQGMIDLIRTPKEQAAFRTNHALSLAKAGRTAEALKEIEELVAAQLLPKSVLGNAAAVYSLASAKSSEREVLQQKAIKSLRAAKKAGSLPINFPSGKEFDPLRARADFPKLVNELRNAPSK